MTPEDVVKLAERKAAQIARINELSQLARTAWFSLLGYLVFVGITLLGVRDADFFVPSRQTDLPLVNVAIPTASFFWIAPVLGAALYAYLHLFLIKLWDAHGEASTADSDATHHWLVNDFVLIRQRDPVARARPLAFLSDWITRLLVWAAGPLVLGYACWRSMPAHAVWLTLLVAACFWLTVVVGFTSWWRAEARIGGRRPGPGGALWRKTLAILLALVLVVISWIRTEGGAERYAGRVIDAYEALTGRQIFPQGRKPDGSLESAAEVQAAWVAASPFIPNTSWFTFGEEDLPFSLWLRDDDPLTRSSWSPVAPMDFRDERLSDLPASWAECDVARRDQLTRYAASKGLDPNADWDPATEADFSREWTRKRAVEKRAILSADLSETQIGRADFAGAVGFGLKLPPLPWPGARFNLDMFDGSNFFDDATCTIDWENVSFAGMSLRDAQLDGVNLGDARLEGVDFTGARLARANFAQALLSGANLDRANLTGATLVGADLGAASLEGTRLGGARLDQANMPLAEMAMADLHSAQLNGASLSEASLDSADLSGAQMTGIVLTGASLRDADLSGATLTDANLAEAHLAGADLTAADLRNAIWTGFAFERQPSPAHFADLRGAQFLNQSRLDDMIGNAGTLLPDGVAPDTGRPYAIWSCWETPPPGLEWRIDAHPEYLCGPNRPRLPTGMPLTLDAPRPLGHPLAGAD